MPSYNVRQTWPYSYLVNIDYPPYHKECLPGHPSQGQDRRSGRCGRRQVGRVVAGGEGGAEEGPVTYLQRVALAQQTVPEK